MPDTLYDLVTASTASGSVLLPDTAAALATVLGDRTGLRFYPSSLTVAHGALISLAADESGGRSLLVLEGPTCDRRVSQSFEGEYHARSFDGQPLDVRLCPASSLNAAALRAALPSMRPARLGLAISVGCGDRLGLATPGHVRAVRGTGLAPIFAQQSMRENARTGRTPQEVVDDATWGVFQEGSKEGYGADADHLKTPEHIDLCVAAGYTFFTIDPGDHVNNEAHAAAPARLSEIVAGLPWADLETTQADMTRRYAGRTFAVGDSVHLTLDSEMLARAAGKYGAAIAHTARMYRHLAALTDDFELEMSVDETETVTSPEEHFFIASELKRLGVRWVSLAPRYVGRFEKGVDYIGDLDAFAASFASHAAIARQMGPYKLSLHSGSDKFSIYAIAAELADGLVHLKTAGTSYLEALRVLAAVQSDLFRQILDLSIAHYETDRATYHVSAQLDRVPDPAVVPDDALVSYLEDFDARQVLHVTFGRVLATYGDLIKAALRQHEEAHYAALEAHFRRHLAPFGAVYK